MTVARKLKRSVRARARKTGESYAAARRQVLAKRTPTAPYVRPAPPEAAVAPASPPAATGMVSAARVLAVTGQPLEHWFDVLARFDALTHGHTAAARHLRDAHGVSAWYAQGITGSYERARGLRVVNQKCSGDFEVSISKVVAAPLARLGSAWAEARARERWLGDASPATWRALEAALRAPRCRGVRVDERDVRLRYAVSHGPTVDVRVTLRADGKCAVVVQVMKLPDAAAVARERAAWRGALAALQTFASA